METGTNASVVQKTQDMAHEHASLPGWVCILDMAHSDQRAPERQRVSQYKQAPGMSLSLTLFCIQQPINSKFVFSLDVGL